MGWNYDTADFLIAVRTAEADLADLELEVARTERVPAFGARAGRRSAGLPPGGPMEGRDKIDSWTDKKINR